jgi:Mycobacterium 19 kDa lipoprotein antigen
MQNRMFTAAGVALAVAASVSACAEPETVPLKAAHLTIDGASHTTRPPACHQDQSYRTITIRERDGEVEAVVLTTGDRVIPQYVKIRNVDGFTGSFYVDGVGGARAELAKRQYTITGSAYGINSNNPDKVVTTDFKITAEC